MSPFATFARHQVGAALTTVVDFLTMILWVELGIGSPVSGTAMGAGAGACFNFYIGRQWVFAAHGGSVLRQVLRYAMVSGSSLGWNTLGQHQLLQSTTLPYAVTRAIIAVAVAVLWNFPLQRWFVFHGAPRRAGDEA